MGVTFRSGDYVQFVKFGHRTIKDGEAAAVWNNQGEQTEIIGPRRVTLWFSTIRFLYHHQASRGQYLKVEYRNGTTEHVLGPIAKYLNPTYHSSIQVLDGYNLATEDECLVMFGSESNSKKVLPEASRRVLYGPQFVIPSVQESVHTFEWGGDQGLTTAFQILKTNKIELWKKQLALKTTEGPLVDVNLAISYRVETVDKCLDIADPIAHIHTALLCDANCGDISLAEVSNLASQVSTYKTFNEAMRTCGFRILDIHLTGVSFPKSLTNTRQQVKQDSENQMKAAAKLQHDIELTKLDFEKKRNQAEEQANLDKMQSQLDTEVAEQTCSVQIASVENEILILKMRKEAENEAAQQANETRLQYLRSLQEMGIDMTKVLCARELQPPVVGTQPPVVGTAGVNHPDPLQW
mmetsp:Transcript_7580/g.9908  ORF Transcript_7580/g.9908 Transcript_7580/m.9908 type:complete len:408 (+) Transcript_7580:121-1344(+)|eukprot:CAMPEP_0198146366 /NCGR_PEP_ID=MMETSP1443-20131203/29051_1 /TAXON_ID=186043 /ORGANISM="Entomoneis sp., Strain CCMP2396" /LENGTH=407 /DNA_ID=CAMNT_0043810307 /DNA_START=33 /DNA_END=1253 /DNA_ORIENTATION=-